MPLRDGRVWLTSRKDALAAGVLRSLEDYLARRAAGRVADARLVAEGVAMLGAEVARARGQSPSGGATQALDRYLGGPGLDQPHRAEAEAMLQVALRSAAVHDPAAAERLEQLNAPVQTPPASTIISASAAIDREAELLDIRTAAAPQPQQQQPRQRGTVGSRHRKATGRRLWTSQMRGTGLALGERPSTEPTLTDAHALSVLQSMDRRDLEASLTGPPDVQSQLAVLQLTGADDPQHVRVEIGKVPLGALACATVGSGEPDDPHVLRIASGLSDAQIRHVWTQQLSQITQEVAAGQAEQPRGVLGRLKSAFGHERRDRRMQADQAAFQVMLRDWHDAQASEQPGAQHPGQAPGQAAGRRSAADLEHDLEILARRIRSRGGAEPALPWTAGAVVDPQAAGFGVAAEKAATAKVAAPNTPGHLRTQVAEQIAALEAAVTDLDAKATTKRNSSRGATDEAEDKEREAALEDQQRDHGAPERARKLRVTAEFAQSKAARHAEIAGAYEQAAGTARKALAGYQNLLTEIDNGAPPARIAQLAGTAKQQVQAYERSLDRAMPVKDLLMTGVPEGKQLDLPVDDIKRVLAANNLGRLSERGSLPVPSAEYRRLLAADGMVFNVGNDPDDELSEAAQVRLRLKPRAIPDLTEIVTRDFELAEQMSGSLGEGGISVGTTNTHSTSINVGVNLQPLLALAAPGTPLHAAAQLTSPRVDATVARSLADEDDVTASHQLGSVGDHRGESLLYEWSGEWEIEVRKSPLDPWSPIDTVDAGRQQTWVSSPYTVQAPTDTVTLDELGRGQDVTGEFPRHAVTSFTGAHDLTDRMLRQAAQQKFKLDRVSYDHIAGLMTNDPHRLLGDLTAPGGITRRIPSRGDTAYELKWELKPIWGNAQLVGEAGSMDTRRERVIVDFAGINASQTYTTAATATATLAFPGKPDALNPLAAATVLNNVGGSGVNVGPNAAAGRNVSRSGGQSVSMTAISPAVHRENDPEQGVLLGFEAVGTLRNLRDPKSKPVVVKGECQALLRAPENDLLRAGCRAHRDAVPLDADGNPKLDAQGRVVLRGDALPSPVPQTVPPIMGVGENQLRGAGSGLPQNLTGAEPAQEQALARLAKIGLVPPPGTPLAPGGLDSDDLRSRNYSRIVQAISAPRMEAGFNQACQSGLIVMLEDRGPLGTPRWRPFRLSVAQDHDESTGRFEAEGAGVKPNDSGIGLGISSRGTGRTSGRSKGLPLSAGVDGKHSPASGISGLMGRLGLKGTRTALGKTYSTTSGQRINRVTLAESTEPMDRLKQGIRITFAEITDHGDAEPIADVRGTVEIAYDSSISRASAPVFEKSPKPPHNDAVQQAFPVAVDAGRVIGADGKRHDPADLICAAIPALRADSTALPALHAALSPSSLVANREWLNGEYRLPFTVVKAPGNPVHMLQERTVLPEEYQIVVRGKAVALTHFAMSQKNSVDINFTMGNVGSTTGTSSSGGVSGSAGGGHVGADGTGTSGGLSVGRTGGKSQSTTISETAGDERLLINPGTHHEFIERFEMTADIVHNGKVIGSVPLPDARAHKTMAERRALELYAANKLDLPLWVVADAAERYLNDKLPISHGTASGVLGRYQRERQGATTGLAAEHTTEQLTAKLRKRTKQPAAPDAPARSAEQDLADARQRTEARSQRRREAYTSEVYEDSLGVSATEAVEVPVLVDGQPLLEDGQPVMQKLDLRELVEPQIDELAPGLRTASLQLQNDVDVNLDKDSFQVHLEDMLGAGAFEVPIEVPIQGQQRPDVLFVQVEAEFVGPRTIEDGPDKPDGTPDIPEEAAGIVGQNYNYRTVDQQTGHTVDVSGGLDGRTGAGPGDLTGGVATDLTHANTAGGSRTGVGISRVGHFDPVKTHRDVVFTTRVVRVRNAGAAAQASARWKLRQINPADVTSVSEPRQIRARLVQWLPRGDVLDTPLPTVPQTAEQRYDHRPIELPDGAVPVRVALHGAGDKRQHELLANLTHYLEQPGVLGAGGAAEYRGLLHENLTPRSLKAKAGLLLGPGIDLQPMAKPGNGRTMVHVTLNATAVGWELHGPELEGQEGTVWREEKTYRSSSSSNRLTPLTATGGFDAGVVAVSGTIGEQVKEQSSEAHGTRLETSRFVEGSMVTVRIPIQYEATVRTTTAKGHGDPVTRNTTKLPNVARGEMYVRMLRHQYLDVMQQMEQGVSLDAALADARLQSAPKDFGPPDVVATEYRAGDSGAVFMPYEPLLDVIRQAKAEERSLVLLVRQGDGTEEKYRATKDGLLECNGDGGFADAFRRLHPTVVRMAQSHDVDLRDLFNTSPPDGFNKHVADALVDKGVELGTLKGLDATTTAQAMRPAQQHRAQTHPVSAGRGIAPTGHGPSLSGL
ncbi:hypothetical protein [Kribbella sp. NPDC048928]|uniref:hypothetical protein n=1 Tax=Kribbella sp. NPDC048928 TaxID=3364111 RepID=UPI003714E218